MEKKNQVFWPIWSQLDLMKISWHPGRHDHDDSLMPYHGFMKCSLYVRSDFSQDTFYRCLWRAFPYLCGSMKEQTVIFEGEACYEGNNDGISLAKWWEELALHVRVEQVDEE